MASYHGSIPTCVGQPAWPCTTWTQAMVYPHVCGAASSPFQRRGSLPGLSPRVWGSHTGKWLQKTAAGSIPTCVGQPGATTRCGRWREVYPHVCGAARLTRVISVTSSGLSPRVWGSQQGSSGWMERERSIPTCVGQPIGYRRVPRNVEVYPHVCGAARMPQSRPSSRKGLSPRVWGSHVVERTQPLVIRSIPTCVGQPWNGFGWGCIGQVYPHVCGAA